jgi:hypothetical protein
MGDEGKTTVVDRPSAEPRKRTTAQHERYDIGDEIGRGGMGRVVEATDTLLDRRVAVKEALTTDAELLRRFARETKITARLEHPSIVPLYDAGVSDGAPFYVMRRVTGRPLSELIRNAPSLNERLALVPHLLAAAQAIAHAHQRGIIHRDIKPSNILVGELGETVVIDWGLAKVIGEADEAGEMPEPGAGMSLRTRIGAVFGTPGFMAPDQLRGDAVGPQGDVYSLGASLYNLLAAEPPHYASDSTQMMNLAAQGPPRAIAEVVPGAPRELVTIVDTAIDYDPARRYQDAGAFAEDLKRFLAGQLVASHRYSAGEKLVRFVRKHRAAVAIGVAALAILVVVGAIAFTSVIAERDRADRQARLARQGREAAEASRAMADERADQLLLSRARALVDTNPTAAVASLKQLSPKSKLIEEARGIAKAAGLRGVSWAMKAAPGTTATLQLDHTGKRLAQVTAEGMLHLYDLEARKLVFRVEIGRGLHADWLLDGALLMVSGNGPTRLMDASGQPRTSTLPQLADSVVDAHGTTLCAIDMQHRALRIAVADQHATVLAPAATEVALSPDGTQCAVKTASEIVLFDAAGKVRWRYPFTGHISRIILSSAQVAFLTGERIWQASLADGRFVDLPTHGDPRFPPIWIDYHRDKLIAAMADTRLIINPRDRVMAEIERVNYGIGPMTGFGDGYVALGGDGRTIICFDGFRTLPIHLPITLRMIRVIGRSGVPRIVSIGDGAIVVTELASLPQHLFVEQQHQTRFITNGMLLSSSQSDYIFKWFDLAKRTTTIVDAAGYAQLGRIGDDRIAVYDVQQAGYHGRVYRVGGTTPIDMVEEEVTELQLLPGDRLVYAAGNRIVGGPAHAHRELLRTDGDVKILARLDNARYAASSTRELVRGDLDTGAVERVPLPPGPPILYVLGYRGGVAFAREHRVYRWTKQIELLTELPENVELMFATGYGLLVILTDGSSFLVGDDGKQTRLASTRGPVLGGEKRIIVPGPLRYDVVELPSLVRWSLPIVPHTSLIDLEVDLSPDGTRLIEKTMNGAVWLWTLPPEQDLPAQLVMTNFTEDKNGILLWPWQSDDAK